VSAGRPNIIFILADDLGYGDVGCFNARSRIPTPNMDRLAGEGMRFTNMHSPSAVCTPTRYGIMTGRYCWRTHLKDRVLYNYEKPLIERDRFTAASMLKRAGYHTACIGKWHLGLDWAVKPGETFALFDRPLPWPGDPPPPDEEAKIDFSQPVTGGPVELGFDYFFGSSGCTTGQPPYCFIENDRTIGIPSVMKVPPGDYRSGLMVPDWQDSEADTTFARKAVEYIEQRANGPDPFFLYLAASAPHEPCVDSVVPEFALGKSRAGPRGDLAWLFDWMVGEVMNAAERTGIADDTLIMVSSDNGALPGCLGKTFGHKSNGDWRGYKGYIWEGGHREPFIARWPGRVPAGASTDQLAGLQDFMATAASLVGESLPLDAGEDSADLLPVLMGEEIDGPVREDLIHHSCLGVFSIRRGDWKLIVDCDNSGDIGRDVHGSKGSGPVPGSPGQLYNVKDDPGEVYNLYSQETGTVNELGELLQRYRTSGRSV
jgi:arylsulfatase A-like enzyme